MTNKNSAYVSAVYEIASAENKVEVVKQELSAVAASIDANNDLRTALTNSSVPAMQRSQILQELLDGKVTSVTQACVALLVVSGKTADIAAVAQGLVHKSAQTSGRKVATVTSAVALSDEQSARLAAALATSVGAEVQINNIVDPDVVGGVITTIDDVVIDGSVRTKISNMREAL